MGYRAEELAKQMKAAQTAQDIGAPYMLVAQVPRWKVLSTLLNTLAPEDMGEVYAQTEHVRKLVGSDQVAQTVASQVRMLVNVLLAAKSLGVTTDSIAQAYYHNEHLPVSELPRHEANILAAGMRHDGPFTDDNMADSTVNNILKCVAAYTGPNVFVKALRSTLEEGRQLSIKQVRAAGNIVYRELRP